MPKALSTSDYLNLADVVDRERMRIMKMIEASPGDTVENKKRQAKIADLDYLTEGLLEAMKD